MCASAVANVRAESIRGFECVIQPPGTIRVVSIHLKFLFALSDGFTAAHLLSSFAAFPGVIS